MFSRKYLDYIYSVEWRRRSVRTLKLANYVCQKCGGRATQAHHLNYKRLGHELDSDLMAVCKSCHESITWWSRFWRSIRKWLAKLAHAR